MTQSECAALFDRRAYCEWSRLRLFCFPYAGGSSTVFHGWNRWLHGVAEVLPARLPGRGERLAEAPFEGLDQVVAAATTALRPVSTEPFVLLGYSMGALIAYHAARALEAENRGPSAVVVAACAAPHIPRKRAPTWRLPKQEFLQRLEELSGTSAGLMNNSDAMDLFLPCLRADFRLVETYLFTPGPALRCPVTAYCGAEDSHVSVEEMQEWRRHTNGRFTMEVVPGDHFFLRSSQLHFLPSLARRLAAI